MQDWPAIIAAYEIPMQILNLVNHNLSDSAAIIISAFVISLGLALIALIRNRRTLIEDLGEGEDLGMILDNPSSILPHINELRRRIFYGLGAIIVGLLVGLGLSEQIIEVLALPHAIKGKSA